MFDEKDLLLEARHVTRRFPASGGRELTACNDVNLKFYKGKTLGLIGESGCGKSTFMRLVVRLDIPTEGEILFRGKDLTKMKGEELRQTRQHIQMVFQDPNGSFNPKMRIRDILCEPLMNFGRIKASEKEEKARELLEQKKDASIQDIALCVGYDDAYHFSKLFKKHFGQSPSKYRKKQD